MIYLLLLLLAFAALSNSQKHYYDDFYSLRQAAPKVPADKIKKMITLLNREGLASQKLRLSKFINNNVAKNARVEQQDLAFKQLEIIDDMKQFMTGLSSSVKKAKLLNDKKLKEIKTTFDSLDYNLKHQMSQVFPAWMERLQSQEEIPKEKFSQFDATVNQFKLTWEKKHIALSRRLFTTTR